LLRFLGRREKGEEKKMWEGAEVEAGRWSSKDEKAQGMEDELNITTAQSKSSTGWKTLKWNLSLLAASD
jgi:hypothetical protein